MGPVDHSSDSGGGGHGGGSSSFAGENLGNLRRIGPLINSGSDPGALIPPGLGGGAKGLTCHTLKGSSAFPGSKQLVPGGHPVMGSPITINPSTSIAFTGLFPTFTNRFIPPSSP